MEHSASRHLRRRQLYLRFVVTHLAHTAYTRAHAIGKVRGRPNPDAITVEMTDIDRDDNQDLASAANTIAQALDTLTTIVQPQPGRSDSLRRRMLRMVLRFAGEQLDEDEIDVIMRELEANPPPAPPDLAPGPNVQPSGSDGSEEEQDQ